jgi:L-cystine uptake protein TcyP (sodium:dicarboxylate symporter family)
MYPLARVLNVKRVYSTANSFQNRVFVHLAMGCEYMALQWLYAKHTRALTYP